MNLGSIGLSGPSVLRRHICYTISSLHETKKRSTALITNVDFEKRGEYLTDGPLARAFLDRLVEGAIILKIKGKSYRARGSNGSVKPA